MRTKIAVIDQDRIDFEIMEEAGRIIRNGGLIAFPTETVYGLGANALDQEASKKIYAAKGRPSDNPLIIHICRKEDVEELAVGISEQARRLMDTFWPGPLTLIFHKRSHIPAETTGGLETAAIRMPDHPVALALIETAGVPIAAPSANTSGRPSPTLASHVIEDLDKRIDLLLDGGAVGIGLESTIVDVSGGQPVLLRPGAVTIEMLTDTIGPVSIDPAILNPMTKGQKPKAPGMKYKHYAPKAELILVEGEEAAVIRTIRQMTAAGIESGQTVGILCTEETSIYYDTGAVRVIGSRDCPETIAAHLFAVLREFDQMEVDLILSESFPKAELGLAIMNRLMKAAGYRVIQTEKREESWQ